MNSFKSIWSHRRFIVPLVLVVCCSSIWYTVYAQTPSGQLTFAVLNIGQGDSLFIESPTGVQVLVDGGPDSSILRELPKVMPQFDRSLDAVIATHPDADHIAGLVDLLKRYEVRAFIEPGIEKHTATNDALEREVDEEKIPRYIAQRGMVLDLGGGVYLQILFPDRDVSKIGPNNANNGAVVARLSYGETSVLLTADIEKKVEEHLVALDGENLHSTILKVGHHGSKTSSTPQFVANVNPSMAAISVGGDNKYGHPNKETLDTLAAAHIETFRTDHEGTLVFQSDGKRFSRRR